MDKVGAITTPNMQLPMIAEMQQMAAIASNRVEFGITLPQPAGSSLFAQGNGASPPSFSRVLRGAINSVDNLQHVASDKQTAMDMGVSDDLSGTMLASQKASVAFSAMVQVRNKLTTALDEVMNTAL
ncbi:TPA: flagellar hook-basal body complex protein FliE [Yersinia enterocolitica]|uniref:Flagellar hook-basal body complex protein FliE n=2 Tax=Yersinia enterocolitica TaxID=630 RepID=A0A0E1NBH5_YEREN|nr:flagellar hook-basal body complex protein FliE [Yersinia enterocolitica]CBX72502.1 flagellar hook-basal body complex protein fliE [Yersinia enterocolitica W22703]ADZ43788.1 Flagellar hook-basal body complex protein FliE [Yersinia enterocolitica subsp. palearctica 105.5R(r)]AJJ26434.1 flagellar hook-basal body complex protein FliE [Yersinia enterocolitica]ALG77456.1 flagellar hook-basal body protein FliE [Yersinia enterocolitica]AOF17876.1 flagellar hook-basal body complex protein FliE [Yers